MRAVEDSAKWNKINMKCTGRIRDAPHPTLLPRSSRCNGDEFSSQLVNAEVLEKGEKGEKDLDESKEMSGNFSL